MDLPLDFSKAPYKEKYVDEETPMFARWYLFGTHDDGLVDIAGPAGDVCIRVPEPAAERIIQARDAFIDVLLRELNQKDASR